MEFVHFTKWEPGLALVSAPSKMLNAFGLGLQSKFVKARKEDKRIFLVSIARGDLIEFGGVLSRVLAGIQESTGELLFVREEQELLRALSRHTAPTDLDTIIYFGERLSPDLQEGLVNEHILFLPKIVLAVPNAAAEHWYFRPELKRSVLYDVLRWPSLAREDRRRDIPELFKCALAYLQRHMHQHTVHVTPAMEKALRKFAWSKDTTALDIYNVTIPFYSESRPAMSDAELLQLLVTTLDAHKPLPAPALTPALVIG